MNGKRMRNLRSEEVETIIDSMPNHKKSRVQHGVVLEFLSSVGTSKNRASALVNLLVDARAKKWNRETILAIAMGIGAAAETAKEATK